MILRIDPNIPTSYWFGGNEPETLIYRREKIIKLSERVSRVRNIIRTVSKKDDIEEVCDSILKKVFDQYIVGNSRLSEIYRDEIEC